jgi:hypothetical protein
MHRENPSVPIFTQRFRFRTPRSIQLFARYLWSGHRAKFHESLDRLLYLLDRVQYELPESAQAASMASGHLCVLEGYLRKNEAGIINYREWRWGRPPNFNQRWGRER